MVTNNIFGFFMFWMISLLGKQFLNMHIKIYNDLAELIKKITRVPYGTYTQLTVYFKIMYYVVIALQRSISYDVIMAAIIK